jgi:hypothetical protein
LEGGEEYAPLNQDLIGDREEELLFFGEVENKEVAEDLGGEEDDATAIVRDSRSHAARIFC